MAANTGEPGVAKKDKDAAVTDLEEDELDDKQRKLEQLGPPNFYEADLDRYYKKFDKSLQERKEFKHRLRNKMSF